MHRTESLPKKDQRKVQTRFPVEKTGSLHLTQITQVDISISVRYWCHVTSDKSLREGTYAPSVVSG